MPRSAIRNHKQLPIPRLEHLEARVSRDQKALIERAAALLGLTIGEFISSNLQAGCSAHYSRRRTNSIKRQDSRSFANALRRHRPANAKLREAARKYLQLINA